MKLLKLLLILLVAATFSVSSQTKVKVACIGNSITDGFLIKKDQAYPAQLQLLLGDAYEVHNYGLSGRTLLNNGDRPYIKEAFFGQALTWQPDIVIIKLGTNDSKPRNWIHKSEFVPNYIALVDSFKKRTSNCRIFVCYPIPVFSKVPKFHPEWGITDSIVSREVIPMVKEVQLKTRSSLIDLYTPFVGRDSLFFDGIHPSPEGAKEIAKEVYLALKKNGVK